MSRDIETRDERDTDRQAVHTVHAAAFETDAEARLVDALREQARPLVSRVAEVDGQVVGHILFSPVTLDGQPELVLMGLAPMAVLPTFQRSGVGSALVTTGLDGCRELRAAGVVVLGHPTYYPRFGFAPASRFGLCTEYDVPDDVFMALECRPGSLANHTGTVRYHPAFS